MSSSTVTQLRKYILLTETKTGANSPSQTTCICTVVTWDTVIIGPLRRSIVDIRLHVLPSDFSEIFKTQYVIKSTRSCTTTHSHL